MFPLDPILVIMHLSGLGLYIVLTSGAIASIKWVIYLTSVVYVARILWVNGRLFYNYLNEFDKLTKDIKFWMDPHLLLYLNKIKFDKTDTFITSIIKISAKLIECYLNDIYENHIYYKIFTQCHHPFPNDLAQIILNYICEYETMYKLRNMEFEYSEYNVNELTNNVGVMMKQIKINQTTDSNEHHNDNDTFDTEATYIEMTSVTKPLLHSKY